MARVNRHDTPKTISLLTCIFNICISGYKYIYRFPSRPARVAMHQIDLQTRVLDLSQPEADGVLLGREARI